jgi:hypothetical protein
MTIGIYNHMLKMMSCNYYRHDDVDAFTSWLVYNVIFFNLYVDTKGVVRQFERYLH